MTSCASNHNETWQSINPIACQCPICRSSSEKLITVASLSNSLFSTDRTWADVLDLHCPYDKPVLETHRDMRSKKIMTLPFFIAFTGLYLIVANLHFPGLISLTLEIIILTICTFISIPVVI